MTIFLVLNGMALVFMLYVLVNFWKEGNRTTHSSMHLYKLQSLYGSKPEVFVVKGSQEVVARRPGKASLIRFPAAKGHVHQVEENLPRSTAKLR